VTSLLGDKRSFIFSISVFFFFSPHFLTFLFCRFTGHMHYEFEKAVDEKKRRIYNELHQCDWFRDTETKIRKSVPGGHLLGVILSSDELLLSGKRHVHNIYVSLANVDREGRMKSWGRKVFFGLFFSFFSSSSFFFFFFFFFFC